MRLRGAIAIVCVGVVMLLTGCSSSAQSNAKKTVSTVAGQNHEYETADGRVSLSLNGQLPPNWPSGFPLPSGAKPAGSGSLVSGSAERIVGVFTTSASPSDTYNFYQTTPALTIGKSGSTGGSSDFVGSLQVTGDYAGNITIVPGGDGTIIIASLKTADTKPTTSSAAGTPTT